MTHNTSQLHKLLRIGTSRVAQGTDQSLPAELETLLPAAGAAPAEERLWLALGALELWTRAGHIPPPPAAIAAHACAAEILPPCPPRAESPLQLILQGMHANLLPEWLQLLVERRALIPPRFLPALLDLGTRQPALRPAIAPGIGERGRWLARKNPSWTWAASVDDPEQRLAAWHTGTLDERRAALEAWRRGDPAAARQALQDAWPGEPPEHRGDRKSVV